MSQITTHVLDTSAGKPAAGITVILHKGDNGEWTEVARDETNTDGRVADLLRNDRLRGTGPYRLRFETRVYFERNGVKTFYPFVEITFDFSAGQHCHVPLLLNPFGYATYKGS